MKSLITVIVTFIMFIGVGTLYAEKVKVCISSPELYADISIGGEEFIKLSPGMENPICKDVEKGTVVFANNIREAQLALPRRVNLPHERFVKKRVWTEKAVIVIKKDSDIMLVKQSQSIYNFERDIGPPYYFTSTEF